MTEIDLAEPQPIFDARTPDEVMDRLTNMYTLIQAHPDVFQLSLNAQGESLAADSLSIADATVPPTTSSSRIPDIISEYFKYRYDRYVAFDDITESLIDRSLPHVVRGTPEQTTHARRFHMFQMYVGRVSIYNHETRHRLVQTDSQLPLAV